MAKGNFIHVLILTCSMATFSTASDNSRPQRSPVILVPGMGGNQLEAKLNKPSASWLCDKRTSKFVTLWASLELMLPFKIGCLVDNMKLTYDNSTRTTRNSPGVDIRIPGWGDPSVVEWLTPSQSMGSDYFKDIASMLVDGLGYERNVSLRGAPYDFRKAPHENEDFFDKLKALVEETYAINNNQPVTLIAHSMGGMMSLSFLQRQPQEWKNKYISNLITLNGIWGGTVRALKVFTVGDNFDYFFLSGSVLKPQQITMPSLGWLLPSKSFWNDSEVLIEMQTRKYTLNDLQQFFLDIELPNAWEFRRDTEKYQNNFTAPGVEVHCLHGVNVETPERLQYKSSTPLDHQPQVIMGDGDGMVNVRSLEGCLQWQDKQQAKVHHQRLPDVLHNAILHNKQVIAYIRDLLRLKN